MNPALSRCEFIRLSTAAADDALLPSALGQNKMITLALVGCAHIHTPGFVSLLKTRSDVKVKSVWDHDAARAGKSAQPLGAHVVPDAREIWADPEISAVIICSETNRDNSKAASSARWPRAGWMSMIPGEGRLKARIIRTRKP